MFLLLIVKDVFLAANNASLLSGDVLNGADIIDYILVLTVNFP